MDKDKVTTQRRRLIDLAQGGDGKIRPYAEHLEPPVVIDGAAYEYRVVDDDPGGLPGAPLYMYVNTAEEADALLHIGDLGI